MVTNINMGQKDSKKGKKFFIGIILIIITIVVLCFAVFLISPKKSEAPKIQTPANTFKGPTGIPFVKGPATPPPGN